LPTPSSEKATAKDALLVERLNALDRYTRLMADTFKTFRGSSAKPDRGGNTNMFREHFGAPNLYLVIRAWEMYGHFKPGAASTTESGSFHNFVYHVRVYATGNSKGKRALLNSIKKWLGRDGLPKKVISLRPDKILT
jgi:hypothetical protein